MGKIAMSLDFGQMIEQMIASVTGGYDSNGKNKNGGDGNKVYDVAIVGYGPAGGVMVRMLSLERDSTYLLYSCISYRE